MPEQKSSVADSSEWWTPTQWALEATVSPNEMMNDYGFKMLGALEKSEMAGTREKAMLDAVWQGSSTRMQDEAIDQVIEDARALKNPSEAQTASPRSVEVDDTSTSARKTARTYRRTYDPTNREQIASTLRKEIGAARLKMTLDRKLGRETSPQVKLLAGMTRPPSTPNRPACIGCGLPPRSATNRCDSAQPARSCASAATNQATSAWAPISDREKQA